MSAADAPEKSPLAQGRARTGGARGWDGSRGNALDRAGGGRRRGLFMRKGETPPHSLPAASGATIRPDTLPVSHGTRQRRSQTARQHPGEAMPIPAALARLRSPHSLAYARRCARSARQQLADAVLRGDRRPDASRDLVKCCPVGDNKSNPAREDYSCKRPTKPNRPPHASISSARCCIAVMARRLLKR